MKTCYRCGVAQPYEHYYKNKNTRDGYVGVCKTCWRQDAAARKAESAAGMPRRARQRAQMAARAGSLVKRCNRCGEEKTADRFYANPRSKDRLDGQCMDCKSAYKKAIAEERARGALPPRVALARLQETLLAQGFRRCSTCEKVLPLASFNKNLDNPSGYNNACRDCIHAYHVDYMERRGEEANARKRAQAKTPEGRARNSIATRK